MEILNQFGINPILLAAQVVNFLILLFILKKFLYKPILKVLEERKRKIEESLKNAEEIEKKLQLTEDEKEKILAKTSQEAQRLLDRVKKEIELMKEEGKVEAQQEAVRIIQKGQEQLQAEMEKMKQELMGNLGVLVAAGMEKVVGKVINIQDQKKIIDQEIKNLS
ncbi:MAG: F0F1 ATP synthase subunit B [Candidatus Daviesbacteria bacterium]|nr:F0F1 ATP synthase subunit B [Candidatus Daviesbacteria bacterium]